MIMQITGITLNILTLGGLAVAVGRVVDDAIVVLENIYRHRAMGEDRLTASINGPKEVAGAITAATVTTVGVFLPLGFVGGFVSQFFLPFALTVTFALLASLVCALTVVPVLAYLLINRVKSNVDEDGEPRNSFWIRTYVPAITFALRSRWTKLGVVGASVALFFATALIVPLLPTQFINAGSEKILAVTVAPPAGASSQAVLERAIEAETILLTDPKVELVQTSIPGEGEAGFQTIIAASSGRPANSARMTVRLAPDVDLTAYTIHLADELAPIQTDGYDVAVAQAAGFTSNSLNVIVSGDDPAAVQQANDAVLAALGRQRRISSTSSPTCRRARRRSASRPIPTRRSSSASRPPRSRRRSAGPSSAPTATQVQLPDEDGTTAIVVRLDPDQVTSVDDAARAARRHGWSRSRWARSRPSSRPTRRARSPASTAHRPRRSRPTSPTPTRAR